MSDMASPLVSIVIPCYRQGHFLADAINSALGQTYSPLEVIVVNDGSDDNTDEVARSYGDRIRYISKTNEGRSIARNTATEKATGKYVLFLDSDDALHTEAIAWLVEAMAGSDQRMAVMGYRMFDESPETSQQQEFLPPARCEPFPRLIHGNVGPPHNVLVSRQMVLDVGGWPAGMDTCEDWHLWFRMALAGAEIVTVRKIGAFYRRHAGSTSSDIGWMLRGRTELLRFQHRELVRRSDLLEPYGGDLLEAEHRVLRRWLAVGQSKPVVREIAGYIRELNERGITTTRAAWRRLADRMLGYRSDAIALTYFRWFRQSIFAEYRNGVN